MKCVKGLELQSLKSGAGWYIGTVTEEDGFPEPMCRLSVNYYPTKEVADAALRSGFFPKREYAIECEWCRGNNPHCIA